MPIGESFFFFSFSFWRPIFVFQHWTAPTFGAHVTPFKAWRQMLTFIHCLINDRVWIQDPFGFNDLASGLSLTRRKEALQWDKDGAMTQPPTFSRRLPPPPAWQVKKACLSGSWIKNQADWSSQDAGKFSSDKCLARPSPRPARTRRHPEELSCGRTEGRAHSEGAQRDWRGLHWRDWGEEEEGKEREREGGTEIVSYLTLSVEVFSGSRRSNW